MGSLNDKNLGTTSPRITPFRRTPASNNITQFLSPVSLTSSASRMSNISVSTDDRTSTTPKTAAEKKNAKVKRVEIDNDIEMLEPESEEENVVLVEPAAEETPLATHEPSTSSGKENQEVIDINGDTVSATKTSGSGGGGGDVTSTTPKAAAEKKNAKLKRVEIDEDIEMVQADSDEENVVLVEPAGKEAPPATDQPSTIAGKENQEVIDINDDDDDIVSATPTSCNGGNTADPKMKKIKKTNIDDDIEFIEEDVSGQHGAIPEAYNTAETPSELQRSNSVMSENSRIILSPNNDTDRLGAGTRTPNGVADNQEESSSFHQSVNSTSRGQKKRTPAPDFSISERRKVFPNDYEYGNTLTNKPNGRIIVFEENDRQHCREYTFSHRNSWYCRFCLTVSGQKIYAHMNQDETFDVLIKHFCKAITYEESKYNQERIKEKFSREKAPRKRSALSFSKDDLAADNKLTSSKNSRATRSRTINSSEVYNLRMPETKRPRKFEQKYLNSEFSGDFSRNTGGQSSKFSTSTSTGFREVLPADWRLGYDRTGFYARRVIVFEANDRNYAREYGNSDVCKRCHGCYRLQKTVNLKWSDGNQLCVPTNHICKPKLYSEIEQEQLLLQEKSPSRRRAATSERKSKRQRIDVEPMRDESDDSVDNASQEYSNIDNDWNEFIEPSTPPSNLDHVDSPPIASPNQIPSPPLSDENDSELNTSFRFYHPSGAFLNECCEKLELAYQLQAYRFWANITISHLRRTSVPQITHTTADQQSSGFSSISLLFTGSETLALNIKNKLNTYFLQHSAEIGKH
uniref:Uncharacterized protein n=1 Tax=Panagrolaimus davidi TaxID=227884 RepID=A0A914PUN5_9BILA